MSSFLHNGHDYVLYSYENVENLPKGVIQKDANNILPKDRIFKYPKRDSYAGFANLFRYKLLHQEGGCWMDTDVVALKPVSIEAPYVASELTQKGQIHITNCVMNFKPGHSLIKYCLEEAEKTDISTMKWAQTGPKLLSKAVLEFGFDSVASAEEFCPINYWEIENFYTEMQTPVELPNSKAVHFYNEIWRRRGVSKSECYPKGSLYEVLKKKYLKYD